MSNSTAFVGTQNVWQEWYELTTGLHGRLMADALIGLTTSTGLQQVTVTSGGNLHVELQPSTELIGLLGASTAIIGYIKIDQTTPGASNAITVTSTGGTVLLSTSSPGAVKAMASTEKIGALQPSTEVIGMVGGNTTLVTVNLAPTTSAAYSANDLIGTQISIASIFRSTAAMTGVLQSLALADKSTMQASIDLVLFHTDTTGTTYTNDSALTLADADLNKIIGSVPIMAGDYIAFADNTLATVRGIGLPIKATTGTGLYAAAINRSTGPQYTSTGDLILTLGIMQD